MPTDIIIILVIALFVVLVVTVFKKSKNIKMVVKAGANARSEVLIESSTKAPYTAMADIMKIISAIILVLGIAGAIVFAIVFHLDAVIIVVGSISTLISFCIMFAIGSILEMQNIQAAMLQRIMDEKGEKAC